MAINTIISTAQEQDYTFLPDQSSILRTSITNKITVNGVNVIVDQPKRGDIMCVTNQKVVWIDGLSIDPQQLPSEYTPVGICLLIKGNKALVWYKEKINESWSKGNRWDLEAVNDPNSDFSYDKSNTIVLHLEYLNNNGSYDVVNKTFIHLGSRKELVDALNQTLGASIYSAQFLEIDSDKPASNTSDLVVNGKFLNRVVITGAFFTSRHNDIKIYYTNQDGRVKPIIGDNTTTSADMFMCKSILSKSKTGKLNEIYLYRNNSRFGLRWQGGCCFSKFYDWVQANQNANAPTQQMTSINVAEGSVLDNKLPVTFNAFYNNQYCKPLRYHFKNYSDYLMGKMIKVPDRLSIISDFPSGKENTYKLAGCTYKNNSGGDANKPLFYWADWAAGISVNAPGLTAGNWWVPSVAELSEIMRDITYGTNSWSLNPDIINRVISKMRLEGTPNASNNAEVWPHLSASAHWWTSCTYDNKKLAFIYDNNMGVMGNSGIYNPRNFMAITLYDYTK